MSLQQLSSRWAALVVLLWTALARAHTVITYPGYRGNNLQTNGTVAEANGLGVAYNSKNDSLYYPYGMEWIYPCKSTRTAMSFDPDSKRCLTLNPALQVVACRPLRTALTGPLVVAPSLCSLAGSRAMRRP
jgi:hypothetical protein